VKWTSSTPIPWTAAQRLLFSWKYSYSASN
jgi:hypothetical protein